MNRHGGPEQDLGGARRNAEAVHIGMEPSSAAYTRGQADSLSPRNAPVPAANGQAARWRWWLCSILLLTGRGLACGRAQRAPHVQDKIPCLLDCEHRVVPFAPALGSEDRDRVVIDPLEGVGTNCDDIPQLSVDTAAGCESNVIGAALPLQASATDRRVLAKAAAITAGRRRQQSVVVRRQVEVSNSGVPPHGGSGGFTGGPGFNRFVYGHFYRQRYRSPTFGSPPFPVCGHNYKTYYPNAVGDSYPQGKKRPHKDPYGRCTNDPFGLAEMTSRTGHYDSDCGHATDYSAAATIYNLTVSGETGYSNDINIGYHNHSRRTEYVCGNSTPPNAPKLWSNNSQGK
jgi:hypothetical protein